MLTRGRTTGVSRGTPRVLAVAGLAATLGATTLGPTGCGEATLGQRGGRYGRAQLSSALDDPTSNAGYVLGMFTLAPGGVIDGDTIKVEGLDATLRLLGIDTEETFKHAKELRAYERMEFGAYLESMRGDSGRPAKGPTPLGMEAKKFATEFFSGVRRVRLERDHAKEIRGRFNRYLTYVFAEKDGEWVNYNVECVRAGMTPYFTKYGYSRRFHDAFSLAQEEAQQHKLGIWEEGTEHYADYADRLAWWNSRAEFVTHFEEAAQGRPDHIVLTNWDAMTRLDNLRGEYVKVLGLVGNVHPRNGRAPARILLSRRLFEDFPIVSFDDDVVAASGVAQSVGEFIVVQGRVARYTYKSRSRRGGPRSQLQIELKNPEQIVRSPGWSGRPTVVVAAPSAPPATAVPRTTLETPAESDPAQPSPAEPDPDPAEPNPTESNAIVPNAIVPATPPAAPVQP